jgi:ribosomal protein S12 methylthiotransferase
MRKSLPIISSGSSAKLSSEGSCSASHTSNSIKGSTETSSSIHVEATKYRGNAAIVTLGCAKNQVDSEIMLGALKHQGFEIVTDPALAEVIVVNTCGFLESSVRESLDAILEAASYKEEGRLRRLIVAGCMVERYKTDLKHTLPEVDAFLTTNDLLEAGKAGLGHFSTELESAARPYFLYDERMPRVRSTARHSAYVKISEGCNRPCTFCVIPAIRGSMRSRPYQSILDEVRYLVDDGVQEVVLVGQDLTAYGSDSSQGKNSAVDIINLLEGLNEIEGLNWIRLLYAYPLGINERLIRAIVELPKVCNYLDIPLQHSSEAVLKRMKRPLGKYSPRALVRSMREWSSDALTIRTTFIVGFPGETEADVCDLIDFVGEGHFTNVGVFKYSKEEGTESYNLDCHVSEGEKGRRLSRVMKAQQRVVAGHSQKLIGSVIPVLVEGSHEESNLILVGRAEFQAPEVDGKIIINDAPPNEVITAGKFFPVMITEVLGYDYVGRIVRS